MAALAVGVCIAAGVVLRLVVARQSVFGDELSTFWIVVGHSLHTVLSLLYGTAAIKHAEITPPLSFVASWLSTQLGSGVELLRLPSLVAGVLTIPAVYLLGARTVGRRAAVVASALTALSPFMIYYSTEARAYALMMLLVIGSTLAMLLAVDTDRRRWWVLYAVCSCAALYTHYTCAFVLAAQFLWLLWAHPEARRSAVTANVGVLVGLVPWIPGLINDFHSPTVNILSALSPFTVHDVPVILAHWALGYPYAGSVSLTPVSLSELPGVAGLVLLAVATFLAAAGLVAAPGLGRFAGGGARDRRMLLIVALALATPAGEAVVSLLSTHIFGVRNLAASWPALALSFAWLLTAGPPALRIACPLVAIAAFALGSERLLLARNQRTDYQAAAALIDRYEPDAVVIDGTGNISPGPLTPLDVALRRPVRLVRAEAPAERSHPFGFADPIVSTAQATREALAEARGAPIVVVSTLSPPSGFAPLDLRTAPLKVRLPAPYRLVQTHIYPGIARTEVRIYTAGGPGAR